MNKILSVNRSLLNECYIISLANEFEPNELYYWSSFSFDDRSHRSSTLRKIKLMRERILTFKSCPK